MADRVIRYLPRLNQQGRRRVRSIGHHQQLLLRSGRIFLILGALTLISQLTTAAAASSNAEHLFVALLLWLLGTAFAMLSLVVQQFPGLAAAAGAVARALRTTCLAASSQASSTALHLMPRSVRALLSPETSP